MEVVIFEDDLERAPRGDHGIVDGPDLGSDVVPRLVVAAEYFADVDDHVDFVGAGPRGRGCLENLDLGGAVPVGEANHGADEHPSTNESGLCAGGAVGLNACRGDLVLFSEGEARVDFGVSKVRLEQRVVDELCKLWEGHRDGAGVAG